MGNGAVNHEIETVSTITIDGVLSVLMQNVDENISLGMGDPTVYSCFHTSYVAGDSVVEALHSDKFNGYSPTVGLTQTRREIAEYLSCDLAYKISSDDVFITSGCTQAIDVALMMLAQPGANILIPRPASQFMNSVLPLDILKFGISIFSPRKAGKLILIWLKQ